MWPCLADGAHTQQNKVVHIFLYRNLQIWEIVRGWKTFAHSTTSTHQGFPMVLKSSKYMSYSIRAISSITRLSSRTQLCRDVHYHPLKENQDQLLKHTLSQSYLELRTSSWYRISVTKPSPKRVDVGAILQRNRCPHHDIATSKYMMFVDGLGPNACAFIAQVIYASVHNSIRRANRHSFVKISLPHSDTVLLTCCRHHFNRAPLD